MNQKELDRLRSWPLHHAWGVQSILAEEGESTLNVEVSDEMSNPVGALHGGIIYALCDVAAYSALLSIIDESESGVTHQINVQVLRPVAIGAALSLKGSVIKRGRSLAFIEVKGYVNNKVVASATVTKSMIKTA